MAKKKIVEEITQGTIRDGEYHPAANMAMNWYREIQLTKPREYMIAREAIASTALSGNRMAEICWETLDRLDNGRPISDRYLLGLCWFLMELINQPIIKPKKKKKV